MLGVRLVEKAGEGGRASYVALLRVSWLGDEAALRTQSGCEWDWRDLDRAVRMLRKECGYSHAIIVETSVGNFRNPAS